MLRVRIEIVPYGDETKTREIGRMQFALRPERPDPAVGEYDVTVWEEARRSPMQDPIGLVKTTSFELTDHLRVRGAFELVRRGLVKLLEGR